MLGFLLGAAIVVGIILVAMLLSHILDLLLGNMLENAIFLHTINFISIMIMLFSTWLFGNILLNFIIGGYK